MKSMQIFLSCLLWVLIAVFPAHAGAGDLTVSGLDRADSPVRHFKGEGAQVVGAAAKDGECDHSAAEQAGGSHGECGHKASCCVGVGAAPPVPAMLFASTFSSAASSACEPAMTVHIPATPKRPPRRDSLT